MYLFSHGTYVVHAILYIINLFNAKFIYTFLFLNIFDLFYNFSYLQRNAIFSELEFGEFFIIFPKSH